MDLFNRKRIAAMDARIRDLECERHARLSSLSELGPMVSHLELERVIANAGRIRVHHQNSTAPDLDYQWQSDSVSLRSLVLHMLAHLQLHVQLPSQPDRPPDPQPAKLVSSPKAEA